MEDSRINLRLGNYTGEKPIEVVIREGAAPRALDIKAPEKIDVSGILSTPLDWLEKRVDTIDQHQANVLVNREDMKIILTVNERDAYTKGVISGTAQYSEIFVALGINDSSKGWIPAKLGQFLRMNRAAFEDKEECMKLVSALKNFSAKCNSEIQKVRDSSGSRADVYRQTVESNLPKSFSIRIPIFRGPDKVSFNVEFDHYVSDGDVMLQLVSPGAKEITEEWRDQSIDTVVSGIREIAPDIAILEE